MNRVKTCLAQKWIQFPSYHGVATGPSLQFNLTLNRFMCRFAVRMKIDRTMISFNDRYRAAFSQIVFQCIQRLDRPGEMLQNETNKNMIEKFRHKGQIKNIRLFKVNIGQARRHRFSSGFNKRGLGYINRSNQGIRAVFRKRYRLRANTATGFQNTASRRIRSVGVQ